MHWIILGCLAAFCIVIGYIFSLKYKKRATFFKTLVMLCQKLDVEINYSRERLKNLLLGFDDKTKKQLQGLTQNYVAYLDNTVPLEDATLFKGMTFLNQTEKDVILLFFKSLGRSDVDSQSKEIKNYEKRFEDMSAASLNENKKYGTLSIKLGIVAALMVIVILC